MSRTRRVIHGLGATYVSFVIKVGVKLLVTPFYLARLGAELMGFKSFMGETMAYFNIFDFGIGNGLTAIVAKDLQPNADEETWREVVRKLRAGAQIQLVLAGLVMLLTVVLAVFLDRFAQGLPRQYWAMARLSTLLFGLNVAVYLSSRVYKSILVGKQLIAENTFYSVTAGLAGSAVGVFLVWVGWSLYGVALGVLTTALVFFVQSRVRVARLGIVLRPLAPPFEWAALRSLATLSGWVFLASIGGLLSLSSARIVLGVLPSQGMEVVNRYALLLAVPLMIRLQANRIAVVVRPGLTQLVHAGGGEQRSREVGRLLIKITGILGAGAFLGIWMVNGAFVRLWVGAEYYAGDTANLLLAILTGVSIWTFAFKVIMEVRFDFRRRGIGFLVCGIITVVASVVLAPQYGVEGVLAAAIAGELIVSLIWFLPGGFRWMLGEGEERGIRAVGLLAGIPVLIVTTGVIVNRQIDFDLGSWFAVGIFTVLLGAAIGCCALGWLGRDFMSYVKETRRR